MKTTAKSAMEATMKAWKPKVIAQIRCRHCNRWIPVYEDEREGFEMGALDGMLCRKCYDIDMDERRYRYGMAELCE